MDIINTVKKISETTKNVAYKTKQGWNSLPEDTKTGTKLIGAEFALMSIGKAVEKRHPKISKFLNGAGVICYIAAMSKFIDTNDKSTYNINSDASDDSTNCDTFEDSEFRMRNEEFKKQIDFINKKSEDIGESDSTNKFYQINENTKITKD